MSNVKYVHSISRGRVHHEAVIRYLVSPVEAMGVAFLHQREELVRLLERVICVFHGAPSERVVVPGGGRGEGKIRRPRSDDGKTPQD